MPSMAQSLLEYAPADFARVLEDLPVPAAGGGEPHWDVNFRAFAMANFIYAALDQHSADWTDYTSASSPYLPATPSSHSLAGPDAHLPTYIVAREGSLPDERIAEAVRSALPSVKDICARPSEAMPEMGVWPCSQCGKNIDPWDLKSDERVLLAEYLGVGDDCGFVEKDDGRFQLDTSNPWQFARSVDCLAWNHYSVHLSNECLIFWFPSPASAYKSAPGVWWDEERLNRRQVYKPLRLEIRALERTERYQFRMWKVKKMLNFAKQGAHSARFHLTRWRRQAVAAREKLVREMFEGGRGIQDTGLALVALMDGERDNAERRRLEESRDEHRAMRREWEVRKAEWARIYLGN